MSNADNLVHFTSFNKFYQTLILFQFAKSVDLKIQYDQWVFRAKSEGVAKKYLHVTVERGNDRVGGTIPVADCWNAERFEVELDLLIQFLREWHSADPVGERAKLAEQYQLERRLAVQSL